MRRVIYLSIFLLGSFVLSFRIAQATGPTFVPSTITSTNPITWTKENSPYILNYKTSVKAKLIIDPGVVVKMANTSAGIDAQSEISAIGTESNKIYFTSIHDDSVGGDTDQQNEEEPGKTKWDKISVSPNYSAKFENVVFSYAITAVQSYAAASQYENLEIKSSEFKNNYIGIDIRNLAPRIERNIIEDNIYGIATQNDATYQDRVAVVRFNVIKGNTLGVRANNSGYPFKQPTVDAKYNWWGDESGPKVVTKNPLGAGNPIADYWVAFDPWLKMDPTKGPDPVIVVPGIMGSWKKNGVWTIDPIFHTYDNLRDEFLANGYKDGIRFFTFPYEWRNSNIDNAKLLRDKINEIKLNTGRPKVDIVAHSMGGLLAREYIESDYYNSDIDQLITIGTPQLGAPKDYVKWEAGESFFDIFDMAAKRLMAREALENGYFSIYDYIHDRPIDSVQELLPVYDYLYDVDKDYALRKSYPENYPRNEFLEAINTPERLQRLKNIEFTKIIGKLGSDKSVVSGFNVIDTTDNKLWQHGYPKSFNNILYIEDGLQKSDGDKTVPLISAEASEIPADDTLYFPSEHNNLPTDAQKDILEILTDERPTSEITKWHMPDLLLLLVHSPINIRVEDSNGAVTGKKAKTGEIFENIPGSFYGAEEKHPCENDPEKFCEVRTEFITIPNPEIGEYKIFAEGTGNGEYTIEAAKISKNEDDSDQAAESTMSITGIAKLGETDEATIKVTPEGVTAESSDKNPPEISGSATILPNENGWYNSDVVVHFMATDGESGIDTITPDATISSEGADQSVTGTATDKAGISASFTLSGINIDKSDPEIEIIEPAKSEFLNDEFMKIEYSAIDGISGIPENSREIILGDKKIDQTASPVDLSLFHLGDFSLEISAADNAGNSSLERKKISVATNLDAIRKNVDHYFSDLHLIYDIDEFDYYKARLDHIESLFDRLNSKKGNRKPDENIQNEISRAIEQMISHIQKKSSFFIDQKVADLLVEDLNKIKSL